MTAFGEKLKELANRKGMNLRALARAAGVPVGTVLPYASAKGRPRYDIVVKLCRALDVPLDTFAACKFDAR